MENDTKCYFCGNEKNITTGSEPQVCTYCQKEVKEKFICPEGHYICNECKQKENWQLIEDSCKNIITNDPVELATILMKAPQFKMHCPDHHFMVPAVLLSTYCKTVRKRKKLNDWLKVARNRAEKVPGGFCGTHGSCGAAVGSGIFMSTISGATPLSKIEWDLCNSTVSRSLMSMAQYGGPRCCKRVTYLTLTETTKVLKERLSVELHIPEKVECTFFDRNEAECLKEKCPFYPN
ncbi:MAG: hypothetical protein JW833_13695 [Prolixibacteraceae bacterium]|nr:hypothetical protein [Prolixibacteraceae bacterium]